MLLLSLLLALLFPSMLMAQSTQGSILGTIRDATGAVIPNAKVTVTDVATGISYSAVADGAGNYQVLDLIEGSYKVEVSAPGFETEVINDLTLVARQQLRADGALQVGAISQQIAVNAQATGAIETESASIAATYSSTDVQNLPGNYRANQSGTSPLNLIQTLPGVQSDTGTNQGTSVQFSVQGGLPSQADVTVDGITTQNTTSNKPIANAFPSGESISELRVDGVLNNAEFGQPGEVTTVSKSGTNQLHGAGFWYFQNSGFDAIPFGATTKPKLVGNDFGGSAGGPVVVPHLYNGHSRSFFFGTYEGFRRPGSQPYQASVPTSEMKQGNFSNVAGVTTLFDPFTGTPYPNYTVPINSVAQKFLQFFPDPNYTRYGPLEDYTPGQINYVTNQNTSLDSNQFDVRGDQYFGQKAMVYGRFTWKNTTQANPEPLLTPAGAQIDQERILVVAGNYNFTSHIVNEFRFGFTFDTNGTTNGFNGQGFAQSSGLQGLQNLFFNGVSELDFNYVTSLNGDRLASTTKSRTFQYLDGLSWTKGQHNMKFGLDIRHIEAVTPLSFFGADNYGTFVYNTGHNFTGLGVTQGQEFADFLIGTPQGTAYDVVTADNDGISLHYNFYAQDQWKVSSRLTLSYGLRYEYHPGYHDPSGNIGNFNPSVPLSGEAVFPDGAASTLNAGFLASFNACPVGQSSGAAAQNGAPCTPVLTNSQAGLPSGLKNVPTKRFMPRFGFAFRPFDDDKTAVRGGFGMYNITSLGASFYSLTGTLQAATSEYANSETATGPAYSWPQIYAGQGVSSAAGAYGTAYFGTANDINWKDPYSEQYSLSIDHEFKGGYGARISYIGLETHDLVWAPNLNDLPYSSTTSAYDQPLSARPFPNWGTINTRSTGANASYNSLQLDASHHYSRGLTFDSNYTFAKNLADNQGPNSTGFSGEVGGSRASYGRDRTIDFGQVYGTRRHRWNTTMVYELPVGRGRRFGSNMNHVEDLVAGGWQLSNIFVWQSGPFLSAYFPDGNIDPSGTGSGLSNSATGGAYPGRSQKPDRIGNTKPQSQDRAHWVNTAAFACPGQPAWTFGGTVPCDTGSGRAGAPLPIGRFGNSQIGDVEGPGTVNLSSGLSKSFAIAEGIHLRAEGTFTNVLNHTNLADPVSMNLSNAQFGVITAARGSDFAGSRTGQVSMRLEF
jgi:hypothetical protein